MPALVLIAPFIAAFVLCASAGRIGRSLPPAAAVISLTAAALVTALSTGFALSVLGITALAQFAPVAHWGGWSARALNASAPLPGPIAALAGGLATVLLSLALREVLRSARTLRAAARLCDELGADAAGLVIIDDERADAYAVSGLLAGKIVVSRSMLRALSPIERRALLAHEAAHLHRRHHLYVLLTDLAAAANPLLRPVGREVRVSVERWADEIAATESGDRRVVARALARAGLARMQAGSSVPSLGLGATEVDLDRRMRALLSGRPRRRPLVAAGLAAMIMALLCANAVAAQDARERLVHADAVFDRH